MMKAFHLGDILSVTTGRLVAPGHIQAVHGLLDFMTGDTLFTHQLPRACDECAPDLLRQHPDLADVPLPERFESPDEVGPWLAEQVARFGEYIDVAPLSPADHTRINPLEELAMHYPDKPVISVLMDAPEPVEPTDRP
jgi:hypothetical protein